MIRFALALAMATTLVAGVGVAAGASREAGDGTAKAGPKPGTKAGVAAASRADMARRGAEVFRRNCMLCHGAGDDKPGTVALHARDGDSQPAMLEKRTNLSPEIVHYFVRNGISIMPPFRRTEISDQDLDALGAYLSRKK